MTKDRSPSFIPRADFVSPEVLEVTLPTHRDYTGSNVSYKEVPSLLGELQRANDPRYQILQKKVKGNGMLCFVLLKPIEKGH